MRTKTRITYLIVCLLAMHPLSNAQQITPIRGNSTVCPGIRITYTATGTTSCGSGEDKTYEWTVTNGSFDSDESITSKTTTDPEVDVWWDDTPSDGTLTVRVKCDDDLKETVSASYAIRSLTGRTPDNARRAQTLPYCSTAGIALLVDEMTLFNTGGTTGIQLEYADGYEWDLPPGWTSGGSDDGATVRTSAPIINIEPANGCSGGMATVRAYVNCSGRKYSSKANISLSRPQPNISISLPSGYSGPGCGDTQPRTFTVTPVSCAATYTWIFPSGWQHSTFTTVNNYITVTPSGGGDDAGLIEVNVNLPCGTVFHGSKSLNFKAPFITGPSFVCDGDATFTLQNAPNGATSWSAYPSSLIVGATSGNGATVNLQTVTGVGGEMGIHFHISLNNCGNTEFDKSFYAGIPPVPQILPASPVTVEPNTTISFAVQDIAPEIDWNISGEPDTYSYEVTDNGYADIYCDFTPTEPGSYTVRARANYGCGYSAYSNVAVTSQVSGPDLAIESLMIMGSGSSVTISYTLRNLGTQSAISPHVNYYGSANSSYDPGDTYLGYSSMGTLAGGASVAVSKTVTLSGSESRIIVYADPNNVIAETNENNNIRSRVLIIMDSQSITVSGFSVYPVPFTDEINIMFSDDQIEKAKEFSIKQVRLVDMITGDIVQEKKLRAKNANLNTRRLRVGQYVLLVTQDGNQEAIIVYKK